MHFQDLNTTMYYQQILSKEEIACYNLHFPNLFEKGLLPLLGYFSVMSSLSQIWDNMIMQCRLPTDHGLRQ